VVADTADRDVELVVGVPPEQVVRHERAHHALVVCGRGGQILGERAFTGP